MSSSSIQAAITAYDPLGRLIRIENSDGTGIDYSYDDNGNLISRTPYSPVEITLLVVPPGSGTVTGAGKSSPNTTNALTATPESAFNFVGWFRADGTLLSSAARYAHPIITTETLTALFSPILAPSITAQPNGGQISSGSPLSLSTVAVGHGPLSYRWRLNGAILSDTTATLERSNVTFINAGSYTVDVTSPGGTTTSQVALVTIPIPSYAAWKNVIFSPMEIAANNPAIVDPDARVSPDGMSNLLHYALGSKDRTSIPENAFEIKSNSSTPNLRIFEYNHLIGGGGLDYKVEISSNLNNWDDSGVNLEQQGAVTPNSDGITEKVRVALKEPLRSTQSNTFFRLSLSQAGFHDVALSSINHFNYSDENGTSFINSEFPISSIFESTPFGVRVKSNYFRSGGSLITKDSFILQDKIAEYVWEASGGDDFMQMVCGSISNIWLTNPGVSTSMIIGTFINSYEGSWVASPGITYKTTVKFTQSTATMITTDYWSGQEHARAQITGHDFTLPRRLFIRLGDTKDNGNAYILVKALTVKSVPSS